MKKILLAGAAFALIASGATAAERYVKFPRFGGQLGTYRL